MELANILVIDDDEIVARTIERALRSNELRVTVASSGVEGLKIARRRRPDLVILDIIMPGMNGLEVTKAIRADAAWRHLPIIVITATGGMDLIRALEAGADDFVAKPFDRNELLARVRSLIRVKTYSDTVQRQREELSRSLSPQVSALIASDEGKRLLDGHRRNVTIVFCDLRGFTTFAESAEPEELLGVLREYHAEMGRLIAEHGGTLEHFEGDGFMVFFNDPVPMDRHELAAVRMACAMRARFDELAARWRKLGYELAFGVGIATGYATLGRIGYAGRYDYAAIGNVTIRASRLSGAATGGQILIGQRVLAAFGSVIVLRTLWDWQPFSTLVVKERYGYYPWPGNLPWFLLIGIVTIGVLRLLVNQEATEEVSSIVSLNPELTADTGGRSTAKGIRCHRCRSLRR